MFLKIILTMLVVVLITMTVLLVVWWRKHGKKLFEMITGLKKMSGNMNLNQDVNLMSDLSDRLRKLNEAFGTIKKK